MELMLKDSLFVLLDGSWLIFFKLLLASVFWLFEAAHAQVGESQKAGNQEEVADEEIIDAVVQRKEGDCYGGSSNFEESSPVNESGRLVIPLVNLLIHLVHENTKHSDEEGILSCNNWEKTQSQNQEKV